MPKLERPIPESDQLVVRPIALGVIQEILVDRLGLPSTIQINFPGYTEAIAQPKGLISNPYEDNRLPSTDKLTIEVTEQEVKDWLPAAQTNQPEHIPLFLNKDLELEMRPIYVSMEMRINIIYRAKGKTDARRFYDLMALKVPKREDMWLHTLNYSYPMPEVYLAILKEIYRLVELKEGYGDDFETFLTKWINPRYGNLTDQAGKNTLGVFSETQSRVMGYFDFPDVPDFGSKKDDTDTWEIEIPYVIRYEKPKDVYFSYPIVIHNSVLGSKYRGKGGMERLQDTQQSMTKSIGTFANISAIRDAGRVDINFPGRYFPLYDEFMPRNVPENTARIFTTLVLVGKDDDPDPLLLMNINDLEGPQYGFRLNDAIKSFMKKHCDKVTQSRQCAIQLSLYMGRNLMDGSWIEMDEELNIRSTRPLNKRKYYHLRLSIVKNVGLLSEEAQLDIRNDPIILDNILEYVTPAGVPIPVPEIKRGQITQPSFDDIANWQSGRRQVARLRTVQNTKMNAIYNHKR
jgi:hypothetical protein